MSIIELPRGGSPTAGGRHINIFTINKKQSVSKSYTEPGT
jgi:hypothetical protein